MNRPTTTLSYFSLSLVLLMMGFLQLSAQAPTWNLAGKESAGQPDGGRKVLALPSGEAYLIGRFQPNTITFAGGTTLSTISGNDSYLLKYNPAGTVEWVIGIRGVALNEDVVGMGVDPNGDLVFAGNFQDSVVVDNQVIHATGSLGRSGYIAKISRFGNLIYAKEIGNAVFSIDLSGLGLDQDGNVYVGGTFGGALTVGGIQAPQFGGSDMFFTQLDKNGNAKWLKSFGSMEGDEVWGMDVSEDGHVFATGNITDIVQFGGLSAGQPAVQSYVMVNLKSNGQVLGVDNQTGISGNDRMGRVRVASTGKIYVAGTFQNTVTINGTAYPSSNGSRDGMVIQYGNNLNVEWVRTAGGNSSEEIQDMDVDQLGNCYVIGNFNGTANFSGTTISTQSFFGDAFVARYNGNGNLAWATGLGAGMFDVATGYGISLDDQGLGYITGEFASTLTFGGQTLNSAGGADLFWAIFCQSPEIGIQNLSATTYCEGTTLNVPFTAQGCYDGVNVFELQLSDANGSFSNPTALATQAGTTSGTLSATVPNGIAPGNGYRVRVVTSAPAYTSPDNGVNLAMSANPSPALQANGNTQFCDGTTLTLSTTSAFASYLWSDGSTNPTVDVTTTGSWTVTVTNVFGCTGTDNISVTALASPTPVILPMGTVALCNGNSVTLDPGAGFNSYIWSDGSTSQTVTAATAGVYDVTVTSANGCTGASNAVTVVNSTRPTISQNVDTLFSSVAVSYQWSLNGNPIAGATNAWYVPTQSGNYTVAVVTSFGCNEVSDPFSVTLTAVQVAQAGRMEVYPNPANAQVTIQLPNPMGTMEARILDLNGKMMVSAQFAGSTLEMNTQSLPAGFYLLQVQGQDFVATQKVQVLH